MDTESYLSWLPPRPTNIPSTPADHERTLSSDVPISLGRTANSRLVRVVSVSETDEVVLQPHPRRHVQTNGSKPPRPRFNAPNLHLEILISPNTLFRVYFLLFRTFIFAHLLLQTFLDFNVVYIIFQYVFGLLKPPVSKRTYVSTGYRYSPNLKRDPVDLGLLPLQRTSPAGSFKYSPLP